MYAMAMKSWSSKELVRVEMPTPEPRKGEVRVAIKAVSVNPVDWKMRSGGPIRTIVRMIRPFRGPRGPIILGVDFAGVIDAIGSDVTGLEVGQRVVGGTDFSRGQHGSYADMVIVREDQVTPIPDQVAFDVAGSLPVAAVTAWMALNEYRVIGPGKRVLVLGASGGVGQFTVQLAKHECHAEVVVGVCSAKNAAMVEKLGADIVLDYTKGDPLEQAKVHGPFDVIVDCAGGYPARQCRKLLGPMGRHVMVAGDTPLAMAQIFVPPFTSRTILGKPTRRRLSAVIDAVAAGHLEVQIAERFPLVDVEKAHQLSETKRMTGKIVLLP